MGYTHEYYLLVNYSSWMFIIVHGCSWLYPNISTKNPNQLVHKKVKKVNYQGSLLSIRRL